MPLRKMLGADVDRVHEQVDALLDSEDAMRLRLSRRQQGLAAERAIDAVLTDSFPASDPPSWTLGVSRSPRELTTTDDADVTLAREDD